MNELRRLIINDKQRNDKKQYILYWMQQSQRIHFNHALNEAIKYGNDRNLPIVIFFGLTPSYPEANERHYTFMLEGLKEVRRITGSFWHDVCFKNRKPCRSNQTIT